MSKIAAMILVVLALAFAAGCEKKFGVREVLPRTGVLGGGESVTIRGTGFQSSMGIAVYFGTQRADNVVVSSSKKLTVTTPSSREAKYVDVRIETDDGKQMIIRRGFRYLEKASLDIRDINNRRSQRQKPE